MMHFSLNFSWLCLCRTQSGILRVWRKSITVSWKLYLTHWAQKPRSWECDGSWMQHSFTSPSLLHQQQRWIMVLFVESYILLPRRIRLVHMKKNHPTLCMVFLWIRRFWLYDFWNWKTFTRVHEIVRWTLQMNVNVSRSIYVFQKVQALKNLFENIEMFYVGINNRHMIYLFRI